MNRFLAMVGVVVCLLATVAQAPAAGPEPLWSVNLGDKKDSVATVYWLGFSPDGRHLAAFHEVRQDIRFTDGYLRTWLVKTWEEAPRRPLGRAACSDLPPGPPGAFTGQSQLIIPGFFLAPASVNLNDNAPAARVPQAQPLDREGSTWRPVGIWATANSKAYFLLNFDSMGFLDDHLGARAQLSRWPAPPAAPPREVNCLLQIKEKRILRVADISPDGTKFAMATRKTSGTEDSGNLLELQEILTGPQLELKPLAQVEQPHLGGISVLRFSTDSRVLASGSADGTVKLWDVAAVDGKWKERATITGPKFTVSSIAFQPNGKVVAFGTYDQTIPSVWFVDVATGKVLRSFIEAGGVTAMGFSPDGKRLATASMKSIKVWDVEKLLRGE